MVDGLETELGGFARMNTLIEAQRAQNPDTLVIDGGDFSMGTLIQTVFETQAAELRMLASAVTNDPSKVQYWNDDRPAGGIRGYGYVAQGTPVTYYDADGTPITDFEDVIITENGRELKAWDSIARYMASFADTDGDGIANVPAYYSTTHGRKLVDTSRSPLALLKNPNKFTAVYAGLLAVAVLLIVLVVLLIRKLVKKARHRTA